MVIRTGVPRVAAPPGANIKPLRITLLVGIATVCWFLTILLVFVWRASDRVHHQVYLWPVAYGSERVYRFQLGASRGHLVTSITGLDGAREPWGDRPDFFATQDDRPVDFTHPDIPVDYLAGRNVSRTALPGLIQFSYDNVYQLDARLGVRVRSHYLVVLLWPLIACTTMLALVGSRATVKEFQRIRRKVRGLCATCGYDLCESPRRCPECGSEVPEQ
jgi:hypothetical protein